MSERLSHERLDEIGDLIEDEDLDGGVAAGALDELGREVQACWQERDADRAEIERLRKVVLDYEYARCVRHLHPICADCTGESAKEHDRARDALKAEAQAANALANIKDACRAHAEDEVRRLKAEVARKDEALRKVPIIRRSDKPPFSTCLGCGRTEGDDCKPGCWVLALEAALSPPSEAPAAQPVPRGDK